MEEIKPEDWDLAYCYAMVGVQALLVNKELYNKYYTLAEEAGKKIAGAEDKQQFKADLNDSNWFGMK